VLLCHSDVKQSNLHIGIYCLQVFFVIIESVKEWKKTLNKYTENYVSTEAAYFNAADQTLEMIQPFVLLFRCVYCLLKNIKPMSGL